MQIFPRKDSPNWNKFRDADLARSRLLAAKTADMFDRREQLTKRTLSLNKNVERKKKKESRFKKNNIE